MFGHGAKASSCASDGTASCVGMGPRRLGSAGDQSDMGTGSRARPEAQDRTPPRLRRGREWTPACPECGQDAQEPTLMATRTRRSPGEHLRGPARSRGAAPLSAELAPVCACTSRRDPTPASTPRDQLIRCRGLPDDSGSTRPRCSIEPAGKENPRG